jgi:valyl-tRNA synthetase
MRISNGSVRLSGLGTEVVILKSVEVKLTNEKFVNNAPPQVLENERKKQADALSKIKLLEEKLSSLN